MGVVGLHLQLCSSLPNSNLYSPPPGNSNVKKTFFSFSSSLLNDGFSPPANQNLICTKRSLSLSVLALILNASLPAQVFGTEEEEELQSYTDSKEGFTLAIPSSYVQVEKAGATALFEELNQGSNNLGVVVNPVRLSTLADFGTPQFVADKLIQAEKRKESTKDAEVIGVAERSGRDGRLQVYEFEYRLDSTRGGMKRIFSAAFVTSKKLYLLNISHSDKPENPIDDHTRTLLEKVLHSFDAAPVI